MGNDHSKIAADVESNKLPEEIMENDHTKIAASEHPEEIIQHIQSLLLERDGESDKLPEEIMGNDHSKTAASELPEEIIQHIQSLIISERDGDERDAARTSLLSKSWHDAWTTRPNLSFDQNKFRNRVDEFPIFTKKTMQRYEDLNRNIKSFTLMIKKEYDEDDSLLARELILKAIKLGAIDLTIEFPTSDKSRCFVLPDEALESETLVRLSVLGLKIDLERRNKAVACPNLKFLKLSHASVKGDLIGDLISRCPSIEELTVIHTTTTTTTCSFEDERRRWSPSHDEFDNLKCLRLIGLGVKLHDYAELWNRSPSLKELVIWDDECEHVRICSPSLERITIRIFRRGRIWKRILRRGRIWNGEFDVPNIQNLKISAGCCYYAPLLKIKSSDKVWEIKGSDTEWEIKGSHVMKTHRLCGFSLSIS